MGTDNWNHLKYLHHKVRQMVRRGWLLKTYYDHMIMEARVQTGEKIENDRLDWLHPVGFLGRVKPSKKTEIFTVDVGADPSRRVVLAVIGDRKTHPKIDEGESILYSPGDPKKYVRVRKGAENGDDSAASGENKKKGAIETDADDLPIRATTKDALSNKMDKGIGNETKDGNFTIKAGGNTQFTAQKHIRKGETHREGPVFVQGVVNATDLLAGGGTSIGVTALAADEQREDGTKTWSATGKPGTVSLLAVAQQVAENVQAQAAKNAEFQSQLDAMNAAFGGAMADFVATFNAFKAAQEAKNTEFNNRITALEGTVAFHTTQIASLDARVHALEIA
jgi:hypothetical protein